MSEAPNSIPLDRRDLELLDRIHVEARACLDRMAQPVCDAGYESVARKNEAQAVLALVQAGKTLSKRPDDRGFRR